MVMNHEPRAHSKARKVLIRGLCVLGVILVIAGLWLANRHAAATSANPVASQASDPKDLPVVTPTPTIMAADPDDLVATPSPPPPASPQGDKKSDGPEVKPGDVERIYMPSNNPNMVIDAAVQPIISDNPELYPNGTCQNGIEPTLQEPEVYDVFQCMDFAKPSTNADSTVVLAGHSSVGVHTGTVLDTLSCTPSGCGPFSVNQGCQPQQDALEGREVLLKTTTSGNKWLSYTITDVECPEVELTEESKLIRQSLWKPTPGRLLIVTCLWQTETGYETTRNLIVQAEFTKVVK